jgi:hypothetical protein
VKKAIVMFLVFLILCNLPPLKWPFTWFDHDDYRYSNDNGSFTYAEFQFKERDFAMGWRRFTDFKKECKCADTTLFRLNHNNPFKFWRYGDYLFKKKYRLPYQSWDKIEKRRGPIDHLNAQDF